MKKWGKITGWAILGTTLFIGGMLTNGYSEVFKGSKKNNQKYPHHIGYLDPSNPDMDKEFRRCNPDVLPYGFYSSAFKYAFKNNPTQFKESIIPRFNKESTFSDSGFLGIRFLIDCKGNIGDYEINELNLDYKKTDFEKDMVDGLLHLCLNKEHWKGSKNVDTYMYLILKIENGQILEIIP